jgi:hypothetical protein
VIDIKQKKAKIKRKRQITLFLDAEVAKKIMEYKNPPTICEC